MCHSRCLPCVVTKQTGTPAVLLNKNPKSIVSKSSMQAGFGILQKYSSPISDYVKVYLNRMARGRLPPTSH